MGIASRVARCFNAVPANTHLQRTAIPHRVRAASAAWSVCPKPSWHGRMVNRMPDVIPFLTYEDGIAALEWLAEVFGFTETARFTSPDGRLSHGEMSVGDGLIMLASPSSDYEAPKRHRGHCEIAASWSALPWVIDGVLVYVDDVDEHYARAKAAGAVILSEPEDGPPARRYRVEDLEGHRWMFMARD
jgi:uncharacterized glyoxalase superfamily protein PhnB